MSTITLTPAAGNSGEPTALDLVSLRPDLAAINAAGFRNDLLRFAWDGNNLTVTVNTKPGMKVEVLIDGGGTDFEKTY